MQTSFYPVILLLGLFLPPLIQTTFQNVNSSQYSSYRFDIKLLQRITQKENGNWVVSPSNIITALSILLESAEKYAAFEICEVLNLDPDIATARNTLQRHQMTLKNSSDGTNGVSIKSGNALIVKKGLSIKNLFRTKIEDIYSAKVKASDFENANFVSKDLNEWVNKITNGAIAEILTPGSITPNSVLLLASATYFKGIWNVEFNSSETHPGCFYVPECTTVKMMRTTGAFKYGDMRNINTRVVELPYKDPRYSMVILLPRDGTGLSKISRELSHTSLIKFLDNLIPIDVDIVMPKFSIDFSIELQPILEQLGANSLFSEDASFSELFNHGTKAKLTHFVHKAKIDVGEKGVLAAGSTVAQFQLLTTKQNMEMLINRPFYFFIRDVEAGFIYEGQLTDALAAQV